MDIVKAHKTPYKARTKNKARQVPGLFVANTAANLALPRGIETLFPPWEGEAGY